MNGSFKYDSDIRPDDLMLRNSGLNMVAMVKMQDQPAFKVLHTNEEPIALHLLQLHFEAFIDAMN